MEPCELCQMFTNRIPQDIWKNIFLHVDDESLKNCEAACKVFNEIIKDDRFWIERARKLGLVDALPPLKWRKMSSTDKKWKFNYRRIVMSAKGYQKWMPFEILRNLTVDQHAEMFHLKVEKGGDGIILENNNIGCNPDNEVENCFAFSYFESQITCFVDLVKAGIDPWVLDLIRPKIRVSYLVNHRFDCGSEVRLLAQLNYHKRPQEILNHEIDHQENKKRIKIAQKSWDQWTEVNWEELSVEFDAYPSGMRHLVITISGKDSQFWKGFFGPKVAKPTVEIIMPDEVTFNEWMIDDEKDEDEEDAIDNRVIEKSPISRFLDNILKFIL